MRGIWVQTVVALTAGATTQLVAYNAQRRKLRWMNVGTNPCTVTPGAAVAVVGAGMQYNGAAGGGFQGGSESLNDDASLQAYQAISASGTTVVVWEGF